MREDRAEHDVPGTEMDGKGEEVMEGRRSSLWLSLAALLLAGTGVWIARAGRPYGFGQVALHKLAAVAALALFALKAYHVKQAGGLSARTSQWLLATALPGMAVFGSGAILAASSAAPTWILWLHRGGSLAVLAIGVIAARRLENA